MSGKDKCKVLKGIRKDLANKLNIDLQQKECTFEGECKGTCPKCKSEEDTLNTALFKKGLLAATILSTSVAVTGCAGGKDVLHQLGGDVVGLMEAPPAVEQLSGEVDMSNLGETELSTEELLEKTSET